MHSFAFKAAAAAALTLLATASQATVWDWAFASETGTFTTGGTGTAGTYTVSDFSVTASAVGATLGSQGGGAYFSGPFSTGEPYTFDWDGSSVTAWHHLTGGNSFEWIVYGQTSDPDKSYFFGWDTGNVNNPKTAAYYSASAGQGTKAISVGQVSVSLATSVPEPETYALMLAGLGVLGWTARRRRAQA